MELAFPSKYDGDATQVLVQECDFMSLRHHYGHWVESRLRGQEKKEDQLGDQDSSSGDRYDDLD